MKKLAVARLIIVILGASSGAQSNASSTPHHCSVDRGGKELPYPDSLKGSGIHGTVPVQAVIGVDGCASSVEVVRKLHPEVDQLAKKAVDSWKFKMATKDGKPVKVKVQIQVEFRDPGK